jgi:hypothetical protein
MSTHPGWKRATQVKLIAELQGFWAEDLWDMHHSPAGTLSPNAKPAPAEVQLQIGGNQW